MILTLAAVRNAFFPKESENFLLTSFRLPEINPSEKGAEI